MSKVKVHAFNFFTPNSRTDWMGGDAIIIEWTGDDGTKKFGMIDAGGTMDRAKYEAQTDKSATTTVDNAVDKSALNKYVNYLNGLGMKGANFEWFIISHFHNDHAWWAKTIIEYYRPWRVICQNPSAYNHVWAASEGSYTWQNFNATNEIKSGIINYANSVGVPVVDPIQTPGEGQVLTLGDESKGQVAEFRIYNTGALAECVTNPKAPANADYNWASLMVSMKHGSKKSIMHFDCLPLYADQLIDKIIADLGGLPIDVVHAPHHGVQNGFSPKVAKATRPKYAVFTSWDGYWNPNYLETKNWQALGAEMHHNDTSFNVHIQYESDGTNLTMVHYTQPTRFGWSNQWCTFKDTTPYTYYYLNESGLLTKWFRQIDGRVYYFNNAGVMVRGWAEVHDGSTGLYWYYMSSGGKGYKGYTYTDGERLFNDWLYTGGVWYWLKADGKMAKSETVRIDNKDYNFDASGACLNP